jgi:hypothetical protein
MTTQPSLFRRLLTARFRAVKWITFTLIMLAASLVHAGDEATDLWTKLESADDKSVAPIADQLIKLGAPAVTAFEHKYLGLPTETQIKKWITELDDPKFAVREEATANLEKLPAAGRRYLSEALDSKLAQDSVEVRLRLNEILSKPVAPVQREPLDVGFQTRAINVLRRINTPAAKMYAEQMEPSTGMNLLKNVNPKVHAVAGEWKVTAEGLICPVDDFATLSLPFRPKGAYTLEVEFRRLEGNDGILILLPVGSRAGALNLGGWGGDTCGLEQIDNVGADENETSVKQSFDLNKRYTLKATVIPKGDDVQITVWLNGKDFISWSGEINRLSPHSIWRFKNPGALGIGAHQSSVMFSKITLQMLRGEVERLP